MTHGESYANPANQTYDKLLNLMTATWTRQQLESTGLPEGDWNLYWSDVWKDCRTLVTPLLDAIWPEIEALMKHGFWPTPYQQDST